METRMIKSHHHRGKEIPISYALSSIASQEGCDTEEYDLMQAASEYIDELESRINELEALIDPYKKIEGHLYNIMKELKIKDEENDKKEASITCALRPVCRSVNVECNTDTCPSFLKELGNMVATRDSYRNAESLFIEGSGCIRCKGRDFHSDLATLTDQCTFCGQRYRRI